MSSDLTENDKMEIWVIQCKFGWEFSRARAYWERERAQAQKQQETQIEQPTIIEESLEDEMTPEQRAKEQVEFEEWELRNKKKKILENIEQKLSNEEEKEHVFDQLDEEQQNFLLGNLWFLNILSVGSKLKNEPRPVRMALEFTLSDDGTRYTRKVRFFNKDGTELYTTEEPIPNDPKHKKVTFHQFPKHVEERMKEA